MRTLIWLVLVVTACGGSPELTRGPATLDTPFGELWYDVVGQGEGTPAILLHGGPGINSYYMNPSGSWAATGP